MNLLNTVINSHKNHRRDKPLTKRLSEPKIKVAIVEMLINRLSKFNDRLLLDKLLLCHHRHVRARQQNGYADEQHKLHRHVNIHTHSDRHTHPLTDTHILTVCLIDV